MFNILQKTLKKLIYSKYSDWDNTWVHYSKQPYMKINPKAMHRDPAGIYLFPASFDQVAPIWKSMPYKFIVAVPDDLNVLDLATLTREKMLALVTEILGKPPHQDYIKLITEEAHWLSNGWEAMYMAFMGRSGEFNKRFRKIGYDAIFDDTKTIHSQEVQLLILDPRKIKVIEMQHTADSGYDDIILVMDYVSELCSDFGKVDWEKPKKKKHWGEEKLRGTINVTNGDKYLTLSITAEKYPGTGKDKSRPLKIQVSKLYSNPDLGRGAGAEFDRDKRSFAEIKKELMWLLQKVFG